MTHFEDLSNEVIYEVFEFLDTHHLYEGFFDLNTRFRSLCIHSNLPTNINIPFISQSTFRRYYTQLISSKKHHINSIYVSNPLILDFFFSSNEEILKCSKLQSLIFETIESKHVENVLKSLSFFKAPPPLKNRSQPRNVRGG